MAEDIVALVDAMTASVTVEGSMASIEFDREELTARVEAVLKS